MQVYNIKRLYFINEHCSYQEALTRRKRWRGGRERERAKERAKGGTLNAIRYGSLSCHLCVAQNSTLINFAFMKSEFLIPNIDYEKLFLTTYYNENQ